VRRKLLRLGELLAVDLNTYVVRVEDDELRALVELMHDAALWVTSVETQEEAEARLVDAIEAHKAANARVGELLRTPCYTDGPVFRCT
jgi:hypothetical protein